MRKERQKIKNRIDKENKEKEKLHKLMMMEKEHQHMEHVAEKSTPQTEDG